MLDLFVKSSRYIEFVQQQQKMRVLDYGYF